MGIVGALLRGLRLRKRIDLGPVAINLTERGYSSTTVELGPWSRNSRTGRHRVNLPGPLSWTSAPRRRRRRR